MCWDALARTSWNQFCSSQITQTELLSQDTHPHIAARTFGDVLNIIDILFMYVWNSVLVLALWIVSATLAEDERSSRVPLARWFPRASRASHARRFISHEVCSAHGMTGGTTDNSLQVQAAAWSFRKVLSAKPSPIYTNSLSRNS